MKFSALVRRRKGLVVVAVVVLVVGALAAAAVPYAKSRARALVEARCAAALGGRCTVATLRLARDGVHAADVRATTLQNQLTAEVPSVAVSLDWWGLVVGRRQGVTVRVDAAALTDAAPLDDVVRAVARLKDVHRAELVPGRAWLERIVVERASARVHIAPLVGGRVDGVVLDSRRDGTLDGRWADASVTLGPFSTIATGPCTLHKPPHTTQADLRCGALATTVDLADTGGGTLGVVVRVVRAALGGRMPGLAREER